MMKKGFTLSEVLITLGIVGVVAAMAVPAINNIKPDDVKIKFIKAYGTLTSITSEVLGDKSYYWIEGYDNNGAPLCNGLNCNGDNQDIRNILTTSHPELTLPNNNMTNKFAAILASKMNLQSGPTYNGNACTFTTTDGVWWDIQNTGDEHIIYIDTDVSNNTHLSFAGANAARGITTVRGNRNALPNVDTFMIRIDNETGRVQVDDALGQEYIKTPTDVRRSLDKKRKVYDGR